MPIKEKVRTAMLAAKNIHAEISLATECLSTIGPESVLLNIPASLSLLIEAQQSLARAIALMQDTDWPTSAEIRMDSDRFAR